MENLKSFDLDSIVLHRGDHASAEEGHCLLEVVSMFAGELFSDSPVCVDPVLAAFGRAWNDGMRSDEERAQLKVYITRLPGTNKGPELSQKRGWMAMDWLIRAHTVAWLALSPSLAHHADAIKAQPAITCTADLKRVQPMLDSAKRDATAARAAAGEAAWDAAGEASWDAAWAAAWAAAGEASWDAAWAAAWAAAGEASWAAARAAAGAAARDTLEPTVKQLQASSHDLFSRMIDAK